jgi:ubiquinone biosynthesis protein Coq4
MRNPIKVARAARAMVRITMDPTRLDEVWVLADISEDSEEVRAFVSRLRHDPRFAEAMANRPRLGRVDPNALLRLPEGTLGRAYAEFMTARGLSHEDLELVEGDDDRAFAISHLRETHDLWHVATGFDTDVAGELGLQAVYLAQFATPLPVMLLTVGMLNTMLRGMADAPRRLEAITRGWLLGKRARPLFGLDWGARFTQPLEELRRELAIDVAGVDALLSEQGHEHALAAVA